MPSLEPLPRITQAEKHDLKLLCDEMFATGDRAQMLRAAAVATLMLEHDEMQGRVFDLADFVCKNHFTHRSFFTPRKYAGRPRKAALAVTGGE